MPKRPDLTIDPESIDKFYVGHTRVKVESADQEEVVVRFADHILDMGVRKFRKPALTESVEEVTELEHPMSKDTPGWLLERYTRYLETMLIAGLILQGTDREASEAIVEAEKEFTTTFRWVLDALAESPGVAGEKCLEVLLARAGWDLFVSVNNAIPAWRRERDSLRQGKKRGHAAFSDNWLNYWDDAWAERRENGKGWKVGNKEILNALPDHVVPPDRSTITRQRNKRYKELHS